MGKLFGRYRTTFGGTCPVYGEVRTPHGGSCVLWDALCQLQGETCELRDDFSRSGQRFQRRRHRVVSEREPFCLRPLRQHPLPV